MRQLRIRRQRRPDAQLSASELATIAEEPEQDAAMSICLSAWRDLSTCRPIGMAVGPVPFTALLEWARFHSLDREATRIVWAVVRRIDADRAEAEASKDRLRSGAGKGTKP